MSVGLLCVVTLWLFLVLTGSIQAALAFVQNAVPRFSSESGILRVWDTSPQCFRLSVLPT